MILNTKKDFERAVLKGEEIKHKTIFYTGNKVSKEDYTIGDRVIFEDKEGVIFLD